MEPTKKQIASLIGWGLFALVAIPSLSLGLRAMLGGPSANVERAIYENSTSYLQGKDQSIAKLRMDYQLAKDEGAKSAVKGFALHEASTVKRSKLSIENQQFLNELERNQ
jgi:hypothetical protein